MRAKIAERIVRGAVWRRALAAAACVALTTGVLVSYGGTAAPRDSTLPGSICSELITGGKANPDVVIVSDLPLRQGTYTSTTRGMVAAIRFVLARHGFRAGTFTVGYSSCDDSTAAEGLFTPKRCAANAKIYAEHREVIGVIGPFNSPCAAVEIPTLNKAPDGPLALISPSNTDPGLTRASPGTPSDVPAKYYPTGVRSYVRLPPTDDAVAAAGAALLRRLGATRVFVLRGDEPYGQSMATIFAGLAPKAGVIVRGRKTFAHDAKSYLALARAIKRSRANGVFIAGCPYLKGATLPTQLRETLGTRMPFVAIDCFASSKTLPGFPGRLYVTTAQRDVSLLPARGKDIVRRFGAGRQPGLGAPYAAQATEALLTAIAGSDGTRASVVRELFAYQAKNSYIGDVTFDRNGDNTENRVTVFRFQNGTLHVDRLMPLPSWFYGSR